ncbi:MAG: HlyD family efflux transporter periplasmic adaptor subunit [Oscillospiraceae bacterium]
MKQGRHYTNLILWILLAAIVVYFGYSVISSLYEPLTTVTAVEYEAGAGYYTTGFVVRDEAVIQSGYGITVLSAAEGEHVSSGASIATGYLTDGAQQRQSRIAELRSQLEQLSFAYQYSANAADQAALDGEIKTSLAAMSRYIGRRDMNSAADLSPELKGLVLRRSSDDTDPDALQLQIDALQQELDSLLSQAENDTKAVRVSAAGYFSGVVDGYETVLTPDKLDTLSVPDYQSLQPAAVADGAIGKLIHGNTWYYVTAVPADEARDVKAGDSVQVTFARDFYEKIDMRVERVGASEAGLRMLVLSCSRYMQNVTLLREQSADVIFASYPGLRVPKDAVRVDENGQPGVYVLESAVARWKPITILHDNGESYVVELDKTKTTNLWPGDEVIVNAKNLYDGKVVG